MRVGQLDDPAAVDAGEHRRGHDQSAASRVDERTDAAVDIFRTVNRNRNRLDRQGLRRRLERPLEPGEIVSDGVT
jgi:hypothetical protein